jgi:hypothetical protein
VILQEQQGNSWWDPVTLDESWFYPHTDHERIWLAPGETRQDREGHTIQSPKFMPAIVWGLLGVMSSSSCPRVAGSFNPSHYTTEILSEVVRWRNEEPGTAGQQLIVHSITHTTHGEADSGLY